MSKIDEVKITEYLSEKLEIKFTNSKFILNGWGQVDNYSKIDDNTYFFLEVETKQKHPCTIISLFRRTQKS